MNIGDLETGVKRPGTNHTNNAVGGTPSEGKKRLLFRSKQITSSQKEIAKAPKALFYDKEKLYEELLQSKQTIN